MSDRSRHLTSRNARRLLSLLLSWVCWCSFLGAPSLAVAQSRYATSDNMSGYVHWIELFDASNTKIDPASENPPPYSPEKTCGRCHEFDTIAHGWHFNAVNEAADPGRGGQPWIWSDDRTGTHLPLSYRDWMGTYNPDALGLSRWQVAAKFGSFLPGGGPGSEESIAAGEALQGEERPEGYLDRSGVTGALPVDCMLCHRKQGNGYSPFVWSEQIEDENFAYAPTAALGVGTVAGSMKRLKDDFDPTAEGAASKLPKVTYEASRFRSDGKVFIDLIRKPENNACYYCHTNVPAETTQGTRWQHDEDVHLRAGMSCADCHRNGLDHNTVRGFEGEQHPSGSVATSLSCQGCHMPNDSADGLSRAGRMGAPQPAHAGLPPLHFDKLTCTACHSGGLLEPSVGRQLNSIAHHLGQHVKRTGLEQPGIVGPVHLPASGLRQSSAPPAATNEAPSEADETASGAEEAAGEPVAVASPDEGTVKQVEVGKYTPHRMMWPSYWGVKRNEKIVPLNPEEVYELIRRPLKVRREFTEELADVKLSLSQRKELLGEDRARAKEEEWTTEERQKIATAERTARELQVSERVSDALQAIEEAYPDSVAIFISGGSGFVRDGASTIKAVEPESLGDAAEPYAWPMAHAVRPARQALGATGCLECHSDNSLFFGAEVLPVGLLPGQSTKPLKTHTLQEVDTDRLTAWNQLFQGRAFFKIAGLIALGLTCVVALSACAINLSRITRR
ncbi:cytochrome c3 family protein [Aureliella helgolandensis]|uniref:Cytochrome c-552/4 domain-containing protein n=1 Tax=Aureliella helgolandensis TaxID=2527968 RepID=A0A518G3F8_9BACT|nr:hypothetical protein [Aureliella helgolandensis]QDV23136.1 hypothetical protein Q31a_14320 [Aureliella helgolandensis]